MLQDIKGASLFITVTSILVLLLLNVINRESDPQQLSPLHLPLSIECHQCNGSGNARKSAFPLQLCKELGHQRKDGRVVVYLSPSKQSITATATFNGVGGKAGLRYYTNYWRSLWQPLILLLKSSTSTVIVSPSD